MPTDPSNSTHSSRASRYQDVGILLVGHGTRKATGQAEFRQLFEQFENCVLPLSSQYAFLELAQPTIDQVIERLVSQRSIKSLLVVPALLFTAGHAENDIPDAVQKAIKHHSVELIGQTPSLECSPEVLQLSALRFQQAVCPPTCSANGCSGEFCRETGLVMVGRGSSSSEAADRMRQFTRLRQQITPVRYIETAFVFGQSPTVQEALDRMAQCDATRIVVQPHLLFSGLLMDQLQQQVKERQLQNVHQQWSITMTLGADRRLAELLARLAMTELDKIQRPAHDSR